MASTIDVQINFNGKTPIVSGNKRLTLSNLARMLRGMDAGTQYGLGNSYVQVQSSLVAASATATCASVVNGNTVTIAGTALTATQRRATGTLTCATAIAGNTCVINGVTFTGVSGAAVPGEATFSVDTGDNETAASIVTQVNAYVSPLLDGIVVAKSAAAVVTLYAVNQGTSGNSISLAGTAVTLAASAAFLAGGTAVANNTFDFAGSNSTTADALAYAINNSTTAAIQRVTATASSNVVTITAKVAGVAGNAITLTSVGGTITVTGGGTLGSGSAGEPTRWYF